MLRLKVSFSDGDIIYTGFHGSVEEATQYYAIGATFNIGCIEDRVRKVTAIDVIKDEG